MPTQRVLRVRYLFTEVEGTIQEDIAKEIEGSQRVVACISKHNCCAFYAVADMARRKGAEISFQDVWRIKGRHVLGQNKGLSIL